MPCAALDGLVVVVPAGLPYTIFLCAAQARALAAACGQHHGVGGSYLHDYARMGRGFARLLGPELTARGRRRWLWYLRLPAAVRLAVRLGRMVMYQGLRRSLRQVAERLGRRRN